MKCTMVFSSSAAALPGRREWAGGQPAVALTLGNILSLTHFSKNSSLRAVWLNKGAGLEFSLPYTIGKMILS